MSSFTFNNGNTHLFGTKSGNSEVITLKAAHGQVLAIEGTVITPSGIVGTSIDITGTTDSTSTTTGSIKTAGGLGVAKKITAARAEFTDTTASTSKTTGSLLNDGGFGNAGAIFTDTLVAENVTDSTSKTTGSIITSGGIGCSKNIYCTDLNASGNITSGTWNGSIITGTYGGTGVNNGSRTLTTTTNTTIGSTATENQLFYTSSANNLSGLSTINSAGLLTNGSGVPGWVAATGTGAPVLANTPTLITPNIGAATGTSLSVSGQLSSTVATGTAPLTVSSTTQVANLNAATAGSATNATNATNVGITDDTTTNATMYPLWATGTSSNLPAKVSSSKLKFNPSTGVLNTVNSTNDSVTFNTANGTLTASSPYNVISTGGAGYWIRMPDATTVPLGWSIKYTNLTTNYIIIQTSTGAEIARVSDHTSIITCVSTSSNVAASWRIGLMPRAQDPIAAFCYNVSNIAISNGAWVNPFSVTAGTTLSHGAMNMTTAGVCTINITGYYMITYSTYFVANTTGVRAIGLELGTGLYLGLSQFGQVLRGASPTYGTGMSNTVVYPLNAGDQVKMVCFQDNSVPGGSLNTSQSMFSVALVH